MTWEEAGGGAPPTAIEADGGWSEHAVDCPYCGERVTIAVEADLQGEMVWDCEVCCRPWVVTVGRDGIAVRADDA